MLKKKEVDMSFHPKSQLIELKNEHNATLVLVTHNPEIARVADRVVTLQDGRVSG